MSGGCVDVILGIKMCDKKKVIVHLRMIKEWKYKI